VFQRDAQRAVHKPLLLLLALARMGEQQPRLARYDDIEAPLKHLLAEFGPSSAIKTQLVHVAPYPEKSTQYCIFLQCRVPPPTGGFHQFSPSRMA
jgi:hypothetical protein